jgi:hypothetical protein
LCITISCQVVRDLIFFDYVSINCTRLYPAASSLCVAKCFMVGSSDATISISFTNTSTNLLMLSTDFTSSSAPFLKCCGG